MNDWEPAIAVALSKSFGKRLVVYDNHEFFQDIHHGLYRLPIARAVAAIDRWALNKADHVICVSEPIRSEFAALTPKPVHVVRNIPELPSENPQPVPELVQRLRNGQKHFVILGLTTRARGGILALQVLQHLPKEYALLYLSPETAELDVIRRTATEMNLGSRASFWQPIPHHKLFTTIRHAYAGMSLLIPHSRKFEVALPNKFFEYLHAGLPVISSNTEAQREILQRTGFGITVDHRDPRSAAETIRRWQPKRPTVEQLVQSGLTWDTERRILRGIYQDLGTKTLKVQ